MYSNKILFKFFNTTLWLVPGFGLGTAFAYYKNHQLLIQTAFICFLLETEIKLKKKDNN